MTLRVAQFSLKIAHLSFSMVLRGPRAWGLRPRLWLLWTPKHPWDEWFIIHEDYSELSFQPLVQIEGIFESRKKEKGSRPRLGAELIKCSLILLLRTCAIIVIMQPEVVFLYGPPFSVSIPLVYSQAAQANGSCSADYTG